MKPNKLLKLLPPAQERSAEDLPRRAPLTLKYDAYTDLYRYLHIPNAFVRSKDLSASARILYLVLCSYASSATSGVYVLPCFSRLARDCGLSERALDTAVGELVNRALVTSRGGSGTMLHVHALEDLTPGGLSSTKPKLIPFPYIDRLHIPLVSSTNGISNDTRLLVERLGIKGDLVRKIAQFVADHGSYKGYVAQIMQYTMTTPCIRNPAGCAVELVRSNERRGPARQAVTQVRENKLAILSQSHRLESRGARAARQGGGDKSIREERKP